MSDLTVHPKLRQLIDLVESGVKPTVIISRELHECEFELDPGCMAIVTSYTYEDGCFLFVLDASPFEAINEQYFKANYWSKELKVFCLKVNQYYKDWAKRSKTLKVWLDPGDGNCLVLTNLNSAQENYLASDSGLSYVEWLERELIDKL